MERSVLRNLSLVYLCSSALFFAPLLSFCSYACFAWKFDRLQMYRKLRSFSGARIVGIFRFLHAKNYVFHPFWCSHSLWPDRTIHFLSQQLTLDTSTAFSNEIYTWYYRHYHRPCSIVCSILCWIQGGQYECTTLCLQNIVQFEWTLRLPRLIFIVLMLVFSCPNPFFGKTKKSVSVLPKRHNHFDRQRYISLHT